MDSSRGTDTVFVRGLPWDTTDEQLLEKFADVGPVKHAYCLRDKATQRATYGFVKFAIREDAQVAVDTLSGALLNGKKIQVENAIDRDSDAAKNKGDIAKAKRDRKNQESTEKLANKERRLRTIVLWAPPTTTTTTTTTAQESKRTTERQKKQKSQSSTKDKKGDEEYTEESADEDSDEEGGNESSAGSGSDSDSDAADASDPDDVDADDEDLVITDEDLIHAVLAKHAFGNADVVSGQRMYGNRAFLVTFSDANKARNAYRRLKKVATAFYPKREFNISLTIKSSVSSRVIVRNLAWKATESDLLEIFQLFGPVRSIHFPRKEEKARGFCFVQYWTRDDALRSVTGANSKLVRGREIAVDMVGDQKSSASSSSSAQGAPGSGGNDDDKEEEEEEEEEEEGEAKEAGAKKLNETDSLTLFVRNLPYGTEEDELYQAFRALGPVHYAKIVRDKTTNRSMGTAFVRFREQSSVSEALSQQPPMTLAGRELVVVRAVPKEQAQAIAELSAEERSKKRKKEDRRHLYLAREGKLTADMEEQIPKSDAVKRQNADREKQQKLTNPNFFVSPTRLSVRNLSRRPIKVPGELKVPGDTAHDPLEPRVVENKLLKAICLEAAKTGMRENVVRDDEGDQALMPQTKTAWRHVKIVQSKVVADDTPVSSTNDEQVTSRGYGFVEFTEHAHALAALRMLNNNPNYFWCAPGPKASNTPHFKRSRLIVEFAVEDAKKLAKRGKKLSTHTKSQSNDKTKRAVSSKRRAPVQQASVSTKRQKQQGSEDEKSASRGTKRAARTTSGDNNTTEKVKQKKKSKPALPATKKAPTTSLVSSMKANAKRWFE